MILWAGGIKHSDGDVPANGAICNSQQQQRM